MTEKVTLRLGPYRRLLVCAHWRKAGRGQSPERQFIPGRKRKQQKQRHGRRESRCDPSKQQVIYQLIKTQDCVTRGKFRKKKENGLLCWSVLYILVRNLDFSH